MNIWKLILKWFGWQFRINAEIADKAVICVAPHTSNWDFILGYMAYKSVGRTANFLMKETWFFWPLKYLLKAMGGIPVGRRKNSRNSNLTESIIERFNESSYMNLAITPEGTRSATSKWRTGFLFIVYGADVPLYPAVIDFSKKLIEINPRIELSGNVETDLESVKSYFSKYKTAARYPEKFEI